MIVNRELKRLSTLFSTRKSLLCFLSLSVFLYVLRHELNTKISVPFEAVATLSTAFAIFLTFNNNSAYDRWWETRKIGGAGQL